MFVRWQKYKSRVSRNKHGQPRLLLVEAIRINGKPRQHHLAYLGSVQADRRDLPRFWYNVIESSIGAGSRPRSAPPLASSVSSIW